MTEFDQAGGGEDARPVDRFFDTQLITTEFDGCASLLRILREVPTLEGVSNLAQETHDSIAVPYTFFKGMDAELCLDASGDLSVTPDIAYRLGVYSAAGSVASVATHIVSSYAHDVITETISEIVHEVLPWTELGASITQRDAVRSWAMQHSGDMESSLAASLWIMDRLPRVEALPLPAAARKAAAYITLGTFDDGEEIVRYHGVWDSEDSHGYVMQGSAEGLKTIERSIAGNAYMAHIMQTIGIETPAPRLMEYHASDPVPAFGAGVTRTFAFMSRVIEHLGQQTDS